MGGFLLEPTTRPGWHCSTRAEPKRSRGPAFRGERIPNSAVQSGRRGDFSPRLPHHRTCGSVSGGSWQSLRTKQHSFSATVIAAQCSANRLQRTGNKTTDGRVLPAKFSPSRVVRPSGLFVSGSLLSVLRPRLTPANARGPLLALAPVVSDGPRWQGSLSKIVNSRCTTGPFISGA